MVIRRAGLAVGTFSGDEDDGRGYRRRENRDRKGRSMQRKERNEETRSVRFGSGPDSEMKMESEGCGLKKRVFRVSIVHKKH
jgi:hypothetical protein